MDLKPQQLLENLKNEITDEINGPIEWYRLLSILSHNLIEEQLTTSIFDLHVVQLLDKENGLLTLILKVQSKNAFDTATIKALEIVYTLINNFPDQIKDYILDINKKCLKGFQRKASARVKTKILDVLLISFEKVDKCIDNQDQYLDIFDSLKNGLTLNPVDTVKGKILIALGLFAKQFRYVIDNPQNLRNCFIEQLEKEAVKKISSMIITNIFTALSYYCESFPLNSSNSTEILEIKKIYEIIRKMAIPTTTNRSANREALTYFGDNLPIFINNAAEDFKGWHKRLYKDWCEMGVQEEKVALKVLKAFLFHLAKLLPEMETEKSMSILKHFINWIKFLMKKSDATSTDKMLILHGITHFANPLCRLCSNDDAKQMFQYIIQNIETNYVFNTNGVGEECDLELLPDYVECLASFIKHQTFIASELLALQRVSINLIRFFYKFKPIHHSTVTHALVFAFFSLKSNKNFDSFVKNVIYQGVIWSCSHDHISNSNLSNEIITVKNFFPLWTNLLKFPFNEFYNKYEIFFDVRKYILSKIIKDLIVTLMVILKKLNVDIKHRKEATTMIETAYQVEKPNDFMIFLNVVDLYEELFKHINSQALSFCIYKMINGFMTNSLKQPLISGFYKLISFALKITNDLNLFNTENDSNQDIIHCREALSNFVYLLMHRIKSFKDELLTASLQVILECPAVVIEPVLAECSGIFIIAFDVGRTCLPIANMSLTALERWQKEIDQEDFEKFLIEILPSLDTYLRSKSLGTLMQNNKLQKKRKTMAALRKRTVLVEIEPELIKFQKRLLYFIGCQNSKICQAFASPDSKINNIVSNNNLYLQISLPYENLTLDIYLECLVLRIIDLSLYCSDRKTRIMACEILYAIVIIFLGKTKSLPESALFGMEKLWKSMAVPLLQLACDSDQVVKQMFEPLFIQIIHWYASKMQRQSLHSAILFDILMEGVTHPTNSAMKDFSGKGLNEFIKWIIKQTNSRDVHSITVYIKTLVKRMRYFSNHPDLNKKLGAAVIFNNIYKQLREEQKLIDIFSIEFLHIFICSLDSIDSFTDEVENTVFQTTIAIEHLKRIFKEKKEVFCGISSDRRIPTDIDDGGDFICILKWLLKMTTSKSKYCRNASVDCFLTFSPFCGHQSLHDFCQEYFPNLPTIYEAHLNELEPVDCNEINNCLSILKWLKSFLCLLDGYIFIMKYSLASIDLSLERKNDNRLLKSMTIFLKKIHTDSNIKITQVIEKEEFQKLKIDCCLQILKLFSTILGNKTLWNHSYCFWNDNIEDFIMNILFNPIDSGLNDGFTQPRYLEIITFILNNLPQYLPESKLKKFADKLNDYCSTNFHVKIELNQNIPLNQRTLLKSLLLLQKTEISKTLNLEFYSTGIIEQVTKSFISHYENDKYFIDSISPISLDYCSSLLEFSLAYQQQFTAFISTLFINDININNQCDSQQFDTLIAGEPFGVYILTHFADVAIKFVIEKANIRSLIIYGFNRIGDLIDLLFCIMDYLEKSKCIAKRDFKEILEALLDNWDVFQTYFEENNLERGTAFLKSLWNLFGNDLYRNNTILNWLLNLFDPEKSLNTQCDEVQFCLNLFTLIAGINEDNSQSISLTLIYLQSKLLGKPLELIRDKVLHELPNARSSLVFKFIMELNTSCIEICPDLTELIQRFLLNNNNNKQIHQESLNIIYKIIMKEEIHLEQKKTIGHHILCPIFKYCCLTAFENFFEDHIATLLTNFRKFRNYGEGFVSVLLVEMLFLRIPIGSETRTNYCSISVASGSSNLRKELVTVILDVLKDNSDSGDGSRQYKFAAYKALASIICNSIDKEAFYEKLFIRQNDDNEDILWSSLIDTRITYTFTMDFDSYPQKRKLLINIRDEMRRQNEQNQSKSFRYLESQTLLLSSLCEDITKFDFTTSVLRSDANQNHSNDLEDVHVQQAEIYLESTEINNHELMGTVCCVIEHIFKNRICQLPSNLEELVPFPKWMEGIRNLLLDSKTHRNVKLFWVSVIENMAHIFKHFARYFMEPLFKFLVGKCAGNSINYVFSDVFMLIITWSKEIEFNEVNANAVSQLLIFLIENTSNERTDIFKYQLEMVKMLVENFGNFIQIPFDKIMEKLNYSNTDRRIEVGLYLVSIFLVNNILPCETTDIESIWKKLLQTLPSNKSTIRKPGSEVIGLLLKYFKAHNNIRDVEMSTKTVSDAILNSDDIDKYSSCIEGVAIHYPDIVNNYHLIKLFNRLPQSDQKNQVVFLKLINSRLDYVADLSEFKSENWCKYLESPYFDVQLISLEIISKAYHLLAPEPCFRMILKSIAKNVSNPNVVCRSRMYDIFMSIMTNDNLRIDDDLKDLVKNILIQGVVDTDMEIREKLQNFFSNMIPMAIDTKFSYLISTLYLPEVEEHFLNYASYFLLQHLQVENGQQLLFEHPLEDCPFEDYELKVNWRMQHPSVIPMFAQTLHTSIDHQYDGIAKSNFEEIRATQNQFSFEPTQATVRENYITEVVSLSSSLLGDKSNVSRENSTFLYPNEMDLSKKYKIPKKRFLKDKGKISFNYADVAVKDKIEKKAKRKDDAKERENKVTIYRKYRKGDFPDIQIPLKSIIQPLRMLALHDSELSKIIFSSIFKTLASKLSTTDRQSEFTENLSENLMNIFTNSIQFNGNLFSVLLDILLTIKKLKRLSPELISMACQQSGLLATGTLILEEYLTDYCTDEVPPIKKGVAAIDNVAVKHWLHLAELYKEMEEWNLVRTIFLEKTNCKIEVKQAINYESEKRWCEAQEQYKNLMKIDLTKENQKFYIESYFKCLAHLGKWDTFPSAMENILIPEQNIDLWDELWNNDWSRQKLLPWYIGANVKNMLYSGEKSRVFLTQINQSLKNNEQTEYLRNKFAEDLSVLWLTQKDFVQAAQCQKNGLNHFLNDWQLINPMYGQLRYNRILNLKNLIEIERFLNTYSELEDNLDDGSNILVNLINFWKLTQRENLPSIILNEKKLLYRRLFIERFEEKFMDFQELETVEKLKETKLMLDVEFMNSAIKEENYYMTKKYFRENKDSENLNLTMIYGELTYLYQNLLKSNNAAKIKCLIRGLHKFKNIMATEKDYSKILLIGTRFFDITLLLTSLLKETKEIYPKVKDDLLKIFIKQNMSPIDIASDQLTSLVLNAKFSTNEKTTKQVKLISNVLIKLAYFVQDKPDKEQEFARFILRAMKLSSKEARQLFPCILLKDSLSSSLKEIFLNETETIPTWMFLGWIPQLLVNVDTLKIEAISDIILRIANEYPQAIMYSYKLSRESYNLDKIELLDATKVLINKLDKLFLNNQTIDRFLTALSKVTVPSKLLEHYIEKMRSESNMENILKIQKQLLNDVFETPSNSTVSFNMQGNMYKPIGQYKNSFNKLTKSKSIEELKTELDNLREKVRKYNAHSQLLKDYCPWLANFSAAKLNLELEIPGQYSGEKMPLPQHHVKISSFCNTVTVMNSLRKPIKITILGANSKEYSFLIKCGEDLRQDQRIEQLFVLMNNIFKSDFKNYALQIYHVIPLTSNLGIIQWIENTISLSAFIKKSDKIRHNIFNSLMNHYCEFHGPNFLDYGKTAMNKRKEDVIRFYRKSVNSIPLDTLKSSLWSLSTTSENFIIIRDNFIRSYATLSACQWILGIGDRHLENFLISIDSGKVLAIDFGHAFGTATQFLPIPELVPIRLTPQIVEVMAPLKEKGILRDILIDCLKSLRKNSQSLIATMNVFIQEPSVDWLDKAKRTSLSDSNSLNWYPSEKISQVKRKLQGASSTSIMLEDLNLSILKNGHPNFLKAYISLIQETSDSFGTILTNKQEEFLTIEDQVDVLISHATDENLLGRIFYGWEPYL